ncbi:unnamed protein product [Prorocentrum cordatum]|uniref:Endoplasmic reticulum resident protein 29 n=1 Tax=Prorocentrum cordatum TaxID=2364126 RepID=A0ABN9U4R8_9DINO|nr:unnamed protein product [Polarella glacialis]|mmetsp:Transcript_68471/g.178293  ORF Transcript_68471/g.178293 Transcript_68471/m.178293 type:complete len:244 (+) Transcript_68471:66-797(+)
MARVRALFGSLVGAASVLVASGAAGAVKLDNYTFDKVLAIPGHNFLVKFDKSYPYGELEDEFKLLCKLAYGVPQFMPAEVPIQEYGDKENEDLRERFGISKDDFPTYYLFNDANKKGLKHSGSKTADHIALWLRKNGVKMPSVGTIDELDALAQQFLKGGLKDETITAAKQLAESQFPTDKKAPTYAKIMQKVKDKGIGYISNELARVSKLMEGTLTPEKAAEMGDKVKILNVFKEHTGKDEL